MRRLFQALLVLVALVSGGPGAALTGAEFLQAEGPYQNGFVNGFVRGMYLTCLDHLESSKQVCSFEPLLDATFDMTSDQVLERFLAFLKANPEARGKEASESLIACLRDMAAKPR
jgi:hypothetical protein